MPRPLIRIAILCALLIGPSVAQAGDIRLNVKGIEKQEGTIRAALFKSESDYKSDDREAEESTPAKTGGVSLIFKNVPPGRYSISCFQDVNDNGKIDLSFIGIPKEPYGFSNNVMGKFGPPSFDQMAFEVSDSDREVDIELRP